MAARRVAEMFGAGAVETFLGLPKAAPGALPPGTKGAILGVPGVTPYASVGPYCAEAPGTIRAAIAGYASNLSHVDFDCGKVLFAGPPNVVDCGDVPFQDDFAANRQAVSRAVGAVLDQGALPIVIGGDDSLPIPVLDAYAGRGRFTILQIDAHIDWRDEVQGERLGLSSGMRRASEMPHIERIIHVGHRALGSARAGDRDDALAWGAEIIPARAVARHGIDPVLARIPEDAQVIICLDVDALDPGIMPAVLARAPGGLSYWNVIDLLDGVARRATLSGLEMTEFVPDADIDGLGAIHAARIVTNMVRLAAHGPTEEI